MPRLFTGLEVPENVATMLSFVRGGLPGARWIDAENYHVTLRFVGDVDDGMARDLALLLDGVRRGPVTVRISDLDVFGGARPRALIAKVEQTAQLMELQGELERVARRAGLPPETRRFTPHVTLARMRDVSPRDVADWLAMRAGQGMQASFLAERFVLFSARASVGGGPYIPEEVYPLDAGAARYAHAR